ncbi:MAG TPA: hypothetical protein VGC54_00550, partial [Planctomycetota bacterium]
KQVKLVMFAPVALILSLVPLVPIQDAGEGDVSLRKDAAFARALTTELGFDDLAELVLHEALERAGPRSDRGDLLLARCDVRKLSAQRAIDPRSRVVALGRAGEAYQEFLDTTPADRLLNQADLNLAEVAFQYGLALKTLFEIERIGPDERTTLVHSGEVLLTRSLERVNALLGRYRELSSDDKNAQRFLLFYPALFYRALIYYYWGVLYPAGSLERDQNTQKALDLLEEFSLEVGEGSVAGLMGYKHMADVYGARGDLDDAISFYEYVVDYGVPPDPEIELTPGEIDRRREVIQDAYHGWLSLLTANGRRQEASQLGGTFQAWTEDQGILLSQSGYRVLLELARVKLQTGGYDAAIEVAQRVASENETSMLRLEANRVMREAIVSAPPDFPIDLGVLYAAAEGAYFDKNFAEAIDGFKLLLGRLPAGGASADKYGGKVFYYLGRSWASRDRNLEAAMTFKEGLERFPDDEENAERTARAWLVLAEHFKNRASGDPVLEAFYSDALSAVENLGGSTPDAFAYRDAEQEYRKARGLEKAAKGKPASSAEAKAALASYDAAIPKYQRIAKSSVYYEKSMVQQGLCEFRKAAWDPAAPDRAYRIFDQYLTQWLPDPANTPADAKGRKNRTEASALADFYRGKIALDKCAAGDAQWCGKAIELFAGFLDRHPSQPDYAAGAFDARVTAFLALGREAEAIAEFEALIAAALHQQFERNAAYSLFRHFQKKADGAPDVAAKRPPRLQAVKYLHLANQLQESPDWRNLNIEGRLRLDLGEFRTAAETFERILRTQAGKPGFTEDSAFFVRMDLIDCYLAQDLTAKAAPIVDDLLAVADNQKNPKVMRASVKILAGYVLVREGRVVEIPGVATQVAFTKAEPLVTDIIRIAEYDAAQAGVNKFAFAPYWDAKVLQAYLLYKWSQVDSTKRGAHKRLIDSLANLAPELGRSTAGPDTAKILEWLQRQP